MKINTQNFDQADQDYQIQRPSLINRVSSFMQSSKPLTIAIASAGLCVVAGVASAAYGANLELAMLQQHGTDALEAYRQANHFTGQDISSLSNLADATMAKEVTPQKGLVLGFMGAAASLASAAAVKVGSLFTSNPPDLMSFVVKFDTMRLNGKFGDEVNMGEKISEIAQMGTIDRWKATKDTPGLFSLVNSFEAMAMKDSDAAERAIFYMDDKTQPSTAPAG